MMRQWLPVYGFEGWFDISDDGLVRTVGENRRTRELMQWKTNSGYWMVTLWVNGVRKHRSIHSLILDAFICPRPEGKVARHRDGDRNYNAASNLEWGTIRQNHYDKKRHGTFQNGESHGMAKLTDIMVRRMREKDANLSVLAKIAGVSYQSAWKVRRGLSWRHVK